MMQTLPTTWIVGCGQMARAMIAGWRSAGVDFSQATGIDPGQPVVEGLQVVSSLPEGPPPELVLLAVKPQMLDAVAPDLAPRLGPETVLVSILAGVEIASLRTRFPELKSIARVMPNLPVEQRRGAIALCSDGDAAREPIGALFDLLGLAAWVPESQFGAVTAVAGSGPAYVARFLDALANAGVSQGLEPDLARRLALQTIAGTAAMAEARGESGAEIADRVTSPGGTTAAGRKVLDEALGELIQRTVDAATARGEELAAAARG
jgi:pyrroline-5-carboxylate reductase